MREPQDFYEEPKQHSHISYKEYQKKVNKKPNEGAMIFVSTFFILLLLFLGIAKQISPEVDVQIGEDETVSTEQEVAKSSIDDRLKLLQEEDAGNAKQEDTFAPELDEKVKLPDKQSKAVKENEEVTLTEKEATPKPAETATQAPKVEPKAVAQPTTTKVVVGYYASKDQAEVAKGIILESGLNISPFVRNIGGAYTIQVGSYSSREKAQSMVNDLLKNNFPARIIVE